MNAKISVARGRILLIDDNEDANFLLQLLLTMKGFDVQTANNGKSGLVKAETFKPDVIILDLNMPGMTGYQVARVVRKHSQLEDVYLLALTGRNDIETRREVIASGFDRHLVKSRDQMLLLSLLDEFFSAESVIA